MKSIIILFLAAFLAAEGPVRFDKTVHDFGEVRMSDGELSCSFTTVTATYTNDEGPYPFDKSLTVYTSAQKKPIVLHLRGTVVKESGRRK